MRGDACLHRRRHDAVSHARFAWCSRFPARCARRPLPACERMGFYTPRRRCIGNHCDGRRSVRTVGGRVSGGSWSLRSFAQSGLCGAGNPGSVRSAPTVSVHLRGHAAEVHDMCRRVSNRAHLPPPVSQKTPCFMCFFERHGCYACVAECLDVALVRSVRPRHRGVAPGNGRRKHDKGVDS